MSLILQDGSIQLVQDNRAVLCYLRGYGDRGILVVANLSHRPVEARTPLVGRLLTSTYCWSVQTYPTVDWRRTRRW